MPAEPDDLADGRRERTVLSTRGRCLVAAGVATAACAIPLAERDLLRVGAFAAVLPQLALLLALFTRQTVRAQRTVSPHRLPVGAATTVTLHVTGAAAAGPLELVDTAPDAAGPGTGRWASSAACTCSGVPLASITTNRANSGTAR